MRANVRLLKLAPAALAGYELRHLLSSIATVGVPARGAHPLVIALLALPLALILRESARGLTTRLPRLSWSLGVLATWLCCSAAVAAMLGATHLLQPGAVLGSTWPVTVATALAAGLLLVVCIHGTTRLIGAITATRAAPALPRPGPVSIAGPGPEPRRRHQPLITGWSDRGPPALQLARQ